MSGHTDPTMIQGTHVPAEAAEQLLRDLVAIPSPSGQEAAAVGHLVDWMQVQGYDQAFVDEAGSAVGIRGQGTRTVVLLGHIDTFGGMPPVRSDGRRLYGRGTVDAKGPLCAFAAAGAQATLADDLRLVVIGAVEEEASSSKGAHHAARRYTPHCCIIGEPSGWDRITLGYKGRLLIDWHLRAPLAHSAGPAPTPAERAVAYWQRVQAYTEVFNREREGLFARLDATLQDIHTEQEGAYGTATMTIGFRLPPGLAPAQVADVLQPEPEDGARVTARGGELAYAGERDTDISRALRGAIRSSGGRPRFVYKTGTSDMNVVGPRWNCPIAAYGPGDSTLDHTPDEHIDLDEYLQAIQVLTDTLGRL